MPRLFESINFPKVITILAAIFGVALGLCGAQWLMVTSGWISSTHPVGIFFNNLFAFGGMLELAVMTLSAFGLVIMTILWIVSMAVGNFGKSADPQKLFDDSDHEQR